MDSAAPHPRRRSRMVDTCIMLVLGRYAQNNRITAKIETIAQEIGADPSTVTRALARLKSAGALDYTSQPGKPTTYTIRRPSPQSAH